MMVLQQTPNVPPLIQQQAVTIMQQAVTLAEGSISAPQTQSLPSSASLNQITPDQAIFPPAPTQGPTAQGIAEVPASIYIKSQGYYAQSITAPHCVYQVINHQSQDCGSVELAVFIYNADGSLNKNAELIASTSDASQNQFIFGTGNVTGEYDYTYNFTYPGVNTVEFIAGDASSSVNMTAN